MVFAMQKIFLQCSNCPAFLHLFHTIRAENGRTWPVDILIVFSNTIHRTSGTHGWMVIGPLYVKNLWASFGSIWRSMYDATVLFSPGITECVIMHHANIAGRALLFVTVGITRKADILQWNGEARLADIEVSSDRHHQSLTLILNIQLP